VERRQCGAPDRRGRCGPRRHRMLRRAWTGEWFWRKMFRPMREFGHELIVPVDRRVGQPIQTFQQPLELSDASAALARTYIYCKRYAPGDVFSKVQRESSGRHWMELRRTRRKVRQWAERYACTPQELKAAVCAVGTLQVTCAGI
jgi:hypothetical protein